jgi:uncharacterized protein YutE (UPF0331/DUF86 family)
MAQYAGRMAVRFRRLLLSIEQQLHRNILVHAYLPIDHGIAWDAIVNDLDDLRQFAAIAANKL